MFSALIVCFLCGAGSAISQHKMPAAVVVIECVAETMDDTRNASRFSDFFRVQLGRSSPLPVWDKEEQIAALRDFKHKKEKCGEKLCAITIGRLLQSDYVVSGTLKYISKIFWIELQLINVDSGEAVKTFKQVAGDEDALLALARKAAREFGTFLQFRSMRPELLGSIEIHANVSGASVLMNGVVMGKTPLRVDKIPVGTFRTLIRANGYITHSTTVAVQSERVNRFSFSLRRGYQLTVDSSPHGAAVYINGYEAGKTPCLLQVPAGARFEVKALYPGMRVWEKKITMNDKKHLFARFDNEAASAYRKWWRAGAGVAAVGLTYLIFTPGSGDSGDNTAGVPPPPGRPSQR